MGPWGLAYWQWIGLGAAFVIAFVTGRVVARLIIVVARRITMATEARWDDDLVDRLARPLRFIGKIVVGRVLLPVLELPDHVHEPMLNVLLALFGVGVVWCIVRLVDVVIGHLAAADWAVARPASRGLLTLAGRTVKFVLVIFAAIAFLGALGLPVGSLLAGVGIGGLALAFGAKQTVENLFGAFALGVDQPLREGDLVRTETGILGHVEAVGLRSTRIRTFDRTIVSLPNGRLADSQIETFGLRDRIRLHTMVGVVYSTTASQLREILAGIERVLRADRRTYKQELVVKLVKLGDSAFEIEVMTWYDDEDFDGFRGWRQDMLLGIVDVIEKAGSALAYPTQTLDVRGVPGPHPTPRT